MKPRSAFVSGTVLGLTLGFLGPGSYYVRRLLFGYPATHVLTAPLDLGESYAFKIIADYPQHGERVPPAPMLGKVEAGTRYSLISNKAGVHFVHFFTVLDGDVLGPISRDLSESEKQD